MGRSDNVPFAVEYRVELYEPSLAVLSFDDLVVIYCLIISNWRQFGDVKALQHHREVSCFLVEPDEQVSLALFKHVSNGL